MTDFTLPTLSVRQPWAWCIVRPDVTEPDERAELRRLGLIKDVENRTRGTSHRGPFLVHASQSFDVEGYRWLQRHRPELPLPERRDFRLGGLVGVASLVDVTRSSSSRWFFGPIGWVLGTSVPTEFVPGRGWLGFFRFKPEEAA